VKSKSELKLRKERDLILKQFHGMNNRKDLEQMFNQLEYERKDIVGLEKSVLGLTS
jgi:hypothetical protein